MSPLISDDAVRLVRSLFAGRSLLDRVRRRDPRIAVLRQIVDSREVGVVPDLLMLLAADAALVPHVARTIADLVGNATPAQLSWLDEQVRHGSYAHYWTNAWRTLAPEAISRLAQAHGFDASVVGLVASHPNGFVRAAALEVLARQTSGQEIPYLSLRANDWVDSIAARARELLISRLRPDNRQTVLDALPFIVRVPARQRRDHREIARAFTAVLLADGGEDALARHRAFDTPVRRAMYELLTAGGAVSERVLRAGLTDADPVIRARAIRSVAADPAFEDRGAILEGFLRDDPVPAVRRLTLTLLSQHVPERIAAVFPHVLLDRAASVRGLARFVAGTHHVAVIPRAVYIEALVGRTPAGPAAAIEGVGETGTSEDADLVAPFLSGNRPRIRRAAVRALATLDAERARAAAIAALSGDAASVRAAAVHVLSRTARGVDFDLVHRRVRAHSDPRARRNLLRVFLAAPKWEAPAFLLEALTDPDDGVRSFAARLVGRWVDTFNRNQTQPTAQQLQRLGALLDLVASRMPEDTAKMLRFSITPR